MIDCSYSVEIMEFEGKMERSFSGLGSGKVGHGWGKDGTGCLGTWEFRFVEFPRRITTNGGNGGFSPVDERRRGKIWQVNQHLLGLEVIPLFDHIALHQSLISLEYFISV